MILWWPPVCLVFFSCLNGWWNPYLRANVWEFVSSGVFVIAKLAQIRHLEALGQNLMLLPTFFQYLSLVSTFICARTGTQLYNYIAPPWTFLLIMESSPYIYCLPKLFYWATTLLTSSTTPVVLTQCIQCYRPGAAATPGRQSPGPPLAGDPAPVRSPHVGPRGCPSAGNLSPHVPRVRPHG